MKEIILDDYQVNPSTMAIVPYDSKNTLYSKVYELTHSFIVRKSPVEVIDSSCEQFGSSYEGRLKGTMCLTGVKIKPPIIINPHLPIYAFPTRSSRSIECAWVITRHIKQYYEGTGKHTTILLFNNNQQVTIPISTRTFDQQVLRAANLRLAYEEQVKKQEEYIFMEKIKRYFDQVDKINVKDILQ